MTSLAVILRVTYVGTKCLKVWALRYKWRGKAGSGGVERLQVFPLSSYSLFSVTQKLCHHPQEQNILCVLLLKHYCPYPYCFASEKENNTLPCSLVDSILSVKCLFRFPFEQISLLS